MARIKLTLACQLLVAVVLLAWEAAANVSLAFPRPDPLSAVVALIVKRENLSKDDLNYGDAHGQGSQYHDGLYDGFQLTVDDPGKPPTTYIHDTDFIVRTQAMTIMLLAIACLYLAPKQNLTTSNAEAVDDILRCVTLIGVILIGFSISAVGNDSTGRISANVAFEIGVVMCLSSLALQNLIAAFMSESIAKLIVLTVISGLLTSIAWNVSFPQYGLNPSSNLVNLYVRSQHNVQQLERYGPEQILPILAGQSMFFSAGLFTLLFVDFNPASLVGVGSICLLQTIIAGTIILDSSAWTHGDRAVLTRTSFAFFVGIIITSCVIVPRNFWRYDIGDDQVLERSPKGKCTKPPTTTIIRKISFIDESMRYPIHRVYTYSDDAS